MSLPYFKHHPQDYLHDSRILKLNYEARGIYWQLINEMWASDMQLPDDDEYVSILLRISLDKWVDVKKKFQVGMNPLIKHQNGKLVNSEYLVKHERAEDYSLQQAMKRAKIKLPKRNKITYL